MMESEIPFVDLGGDGPIIHLAHANGFPAQTYGVLVKELTADFHLIGMQARPLWPNSDYSKFKTWYEAADDLIRFLDRKGLKNIIGMGHSFGAVCTIIAANKRPDLFSKLILIEPVILPSWVYLAAGFATLNMMKHLSPVAKKALQRKERWESREAAFAQFREKKVFGLMNDEALRDYVNAVMVDEDSGIKLKYTKEWEAQIFITVPNPWKELKNLKHPFIAFRGETSDTIQPQVWEKWKRINRTGKLIEIPNSGHLVPLERPKVVAEDIRKFLLST